MIWNDGGYNMQPTMGLTLVVAQDRPHNVGETCTYEAFVAQWHRAILSARRNTGQLGRQVRRRQRRLGRVLA